MSDKELADENKEIENNKTDGVTPKTISQLSKVKEIAGGEIEEFNGDFSSWVSEQMMEAIINKKKTVETGENKDGRL